MTDTQEAANLVTEFLRESDVACPTCLYNLHGAAGDRCPECGTAIRLVVAGSTSGAFWWLSSVFGTAIGAGVVLMTLLHLLRDVSELLDEPTRTRLVQAGMMSASELPRWPTILALTTLLSLLMIGLAWLVTSRRRFGRLSRFARLTIGLTGGLMPLLVLGVLRLVILWT